MSTHWSIRSPNVVHDFIHHPIVSLCADETSRIHIPQHQDSPLFGFVLASRQKKIKWGRVRAKHRQYMRIDYLGEFTPRLSLPHLFSLPPSFSLNPRRRPVNLPPVTLPSPIKKWEEEGRAWWVAEPMKWGRWEDTGEDESIWSRWLAGGIILQLFCFSFSLSYISVVPPSLSSYPFHSAYCSVAFLFFT